MILIGINFPASFDGSSVYFKSSETQGGTFGPVVDISGSLVVCNSVGANSRHRLGDILEAERYLKIVSNVTETADRELTLIFKRYDD